MDKTYPRKRRGGGWQHGEAHEYSPSLPCIFTIAQIVPMSPHDTRAIPLWACQKVTGSREEGHKSGAIN
jgi:hypothetical protein